TGSGSGSGTDSGSGSGSGSGNGSGSGSNSADGNGSGSGSGSGSNSADGNGGTGGTNNADGNGGTGAPAKDDKNWLFNSKEKTHDLFMDGARKYANEHPGSINQYQLDAFDKKMNEILKIMDGPPGWTDNKEFAKVVDVIKHITDPNHNGTALITKGTIDMIRGAVLPGVAAGDHFPRDSRGNNAP
ncbi:hypothetical protein AB0N89_11595, partial [Amycolatopsis sp. NPDC089917]